MRNNSVHVPMRTCISCRKRREKKELIKLVLDGHRLLIRDNKGKGKGRGAYVCPERTCWEGLKKRKSLGSVFKTENKISFHPEFRFEHIKFQDMDI